MSNRLWIPFTIFLCAFAVTCTRSESTLALTQTCPNDDDLRCMNGKCVPKAKICDGRRDCKDGSDEDNCDFFLCKKPQWYLCNDNLTCLTASFLCDNHTDCPSGDDEKNCEDFEVYHVPTPCSKFEFTCTDKMCVPLDLICDGKSDCLDNSDETIGCMDIEKKCTGFICKNRHCLESHNWVCDGRDDCGDNSDEENCYLDCTLDHKHFRCADNETCLPLEKVCNGAPDCSDGSDEGGLCRAANCSTLTCPGECTNLPSGPTCICSSGYRFDRDLKKCVDINECEIFGICSQGCTNTLGSYKCTCAKKFKLKADGKTCVVAGSEALMLYTTQKSVAGIYLQAKHHYYVAKDLEQVIGVTYDGSDIYWTDISGKQESIVRAREDGSKREILVSVGITSPEDLCIDWLTGNIYFTDGAKQQVAVCSNDGNTCMVLITDGVHRPRGIVLYPKMGLMYWSDWGDNPMIGIAAMDGTQVKPFVSDDIHWPNGLTLDWPNGRLYWLDAKLKKMESVQLNGKNRKTVLADVLKHPYGIAVFEDRLYWSDWETKSIQSCNKFTGKDREVVAKDRKIYDIHIYHSALQPRENNACLNHQCSHLCLLSTNQSYTCACSSNMALGADKHTCRPLKRQQTLFIGMGDYFFLKQYRTFGRLDIGSPELSHCYISRLAYNSLTGEVFVADNKQKIIFLMNLKTKVVQELVTTGIGEVSAMGFDPQSNALYWADAERCTVEVVSLTTKSRVVVQHYMGTDKPVALVILPISGKMFITLRSINHTHIDKQALDGRDEHYHLIEEDLSHTGAFTFIMDTSLEAIFWSDEGGNKIESTNFDGEFRHLFRSAIKAPVSIAIIENDLFWSSAKSQRLSWTDKHNIGLIKRTTLPMVDRKNVPQEIQLLALTPVESVPDHPCQRANGGCSHICVSVSSLKATCLCPAGFVFKDTKNTTCIEAVNCEFKCGSGECYTAAEKCNGPVDCPDGSDEMNCNQPKVEIICKFDQFRCKDGSKCVPQNHRCDLFVDCADKSDEEDCAHFDHGKKCHKLQHTCPEGRCIDFSELCDGVFDCLDGSDEKYCGGGGSSKIGAHNETSVVRKCNVDAFRCVSGQCVPKAWECDGIIDCMDASDEHAKCPKAKCRPGFTLCTRLGMCIDTKLVCDGHVDCDDGTDEQNCTVTAVSKLDNKCPMDENEFGVPLRYQCASDPTICLEYRARCNGTAECPRGEDEAKCSGCGLHEFECDNKKCIRKEWVCDKFKDCDDGSDERGCNATKSEAEKGHHQFFSECRAGMFECHDSTGACVEQTSVCDGNVDCPNGNDEGGLCQSVCENNPCEHKCKKTPSGAVCSCHEGYWLAGNKKSCQDINECQSKASPCAQLCQNTRGSYRCSCYVGFMLRNDKISCKSLGHQRFMLYSSYNQIRKLTLNPPAIEVVWSANFSRISSIDVHVRKNLLYFTIENSGAIYQHNMTSNKVKYISGMGDPDLVAVDWVSNNVYFSDKDGSTPTIKVCHMEGQQGCAQLIKLKKGDTVKALTVDPVNRLIFFSVMHFWIFDLPLSVIYKANLDGTHVEEVVKNAVHVTSLAVDVNKKRLFFTDMNVKQLQAVQYDGSDMQVVVSDPMSVFKPVSITLYEDHILIANMATSQITECKLYGNRECKAFNLNVYNANHLVVSQESRQKQISNVCVDNKCSVLCVAADTGAKCLCQNGKFVMPGVKCANANLVSTQGMDIVTRNLLPQDDTTTPIAEFFLTFFTSLVAVTIVCILLYIVYKRRIQHGRFNIGMHFHNTQFNNIDNAQVKMCARPVHKIYPGRHAEIILDDSNVRTAGQVQTQPVPQLASPTYTSFQRNNYNVTSSTLEEYSDSDSMRDAYENAANDRQRLII